MHLVLIFSNLIKSCSFFNEHIKKKLFSDLGDNYNFDFSMRNFYTNPNTTIPNDQGGFANFCFGDMVSAKEGNEFALGRWQPRIGGTYN